jgi:hypothetical protein
MGGEMKNDEVQHFEFTMNYCRYFFFTNLNAADRSQAFVTTRLLSTVQLDAPKANRL